jgi:nitrite reductase/ring-hydroxylating ferredoxin subunit
MTDLVAEFNSEALQDRGPGLRFDLPQMGKHATGFVVRFDGKAYAYVNQCAHVPVELDWDHGNFFNINQDYLICATHGAHYKPDSGYCVMGPCKGKRLQVLQVEEHENQIRIYI